MLSFYLDIFIEAKESMKDTASGLKESAKEKGQQVKDYASAAKQDVKQSSKQPGKDITGEEKGNFNLFKHI